MVGLPRSGEPPNPVREISHDAATLLRLDAALLAHDAEDRIVVGPVQAGEGIQSGLYIVTDFAAGGERPVLIDSPGALFTGTTWTTVSGHIELYDLPSLARPFRVGYERDILVRVGTRCRLRRQGRWRDDADRPRTVEANGTGWSTLCPGALTVSS